MGIVYVEGNIGSGKTSVLSALRAKGYDVFAEPVEMWSEHLARLYHNPADWGLAMHYLAITTHVETILKARSVALRNGGAPVFVERSFASVDVFVKADGSLQASDPYWSVHEHYRRLLAAELSSVKQQRVYLRASPPLCMERIGTRNRHGEDGITLAFVAHLHDLHEDAFGRTPTTTVVDAGCHLSTVIDSVLSVV